MPLAFATACLPPVRHAGAPSIIGLRAETGARRRCDANEEIYAEGDRAAYFYKVSTGMVRTYRLLSDGRRQIDSFHLPGDIFGVEAGDEHRFGADAVIGTTLIAYFRGDPDALARNGSALAREVVAAMMRALERAQGHMMLLGRKSAKERIASFLLGFAERTATTTVVALPMSRADIADHLGLTIESVSRTLTELERAGVIELPSHRRTVFLRDTATLRRLDA